MDWSMPISLVFLRKYRSYPSSGIVIRDYEIPAAAPGAFHAGGADRCTDQDPGAGRRRRRRGMMPFRKYVNPEQPTASDLEQEQRDVERTNEEVRALSGVARSVAGL
jgi:hypothetical protein